MLKGSQAPRITTQTKCPLSNPFPEAVSCMFLPAAVSHRLFPGQLGHLQVKLITLKGNYGKGTG